MYIYSENELYKYQNAGKEVKVWKAVEDGYVARLNSEEQSLSEVVLEKEYNFCPKLSAQKLADGTIVSPSLENMAPFY